MKNGPEYVPRRAARARRREGYRVSEQNSEGPRGNFQGLTDDFIERATIPDLQQAMEAGHLTAQSLTLYFLDRLARFNRAGPAVNAVLEINPEALQWAEVLDRQRSQGVVRGPLHGIPVLVKDNIDTADKMHTSAGSRVLARSRARRDAFLVARLRAAGAIILGKANMTEWANFMADHMPNGYSSRGGQVLNPYGPGRLDVGGSSSGSGAAVAAGFAVAAVGTETSGSILSPASSNGIVGVKPTVGLVSRSGIVPISHSQDTAGPMTRWVVDAAILLEAMAGVDPEDPATIGVPTAPYLSALRREGLQGKRLGVARAYWEHLEDAQKVVMERALEELVGAGAVVVEVELPRPHQLSGYTVLIYEFKPDLNAYLDRLRVDAPVHSLADVIRFNQDHREAMLRYGQAVMLEAQGTSGTLTEAEYINARATDLKYSRAEGIDKALGEHGLDALIFAANYGAGIAAKAGYPSVTVPAGLTERGAPFGLTFTSSAFGENALLSLAYAYEQATRYRVPPRLMP